MACKRARWQTAAADQPDIGSISSSCMSMKSSAKVAGGGSGGGGAHACPNAPSRRPSPPTHSADVHELLGADVVGVHQEGAVIGVHKVAELGVILHGGHDMQDAGVRAALEGLGRAAACHAAAGAARARRRAPAAQHRARSRLHRRPDPRTASFFTSLVADGILLVSQRSVDGGPNRVVTGRMFNLQRGGAGRGAGGWGGGGSAAQHAVRPPPPTPELLPRRALRNLLAQHGRHILPTAWHPKPTLPSSVATRPGTRCRPSLNVQQLVRTLHGMQAAAPALAGCLAGCLEQSSTCCLVSFSVLYFLLHQVAGVGQLPGNVWKHLVPLAPATHQEGPLHAGDKSRNTVLHCSNCMQPRHPSLRPGAPSQSGRACAPTAPQHVEEAQHGATPLLLRWPQHPPAAGALQRRAAARGWHPAARLQVHGSSAGQLGAHAYSAGPIHSAGLSQSSGTSGRPPVQDMSQKQPMPRHICPHS